jgi:hypothetical protein
MNGIVRGGRGDVLTRRPNRNRLGLVSMFGVFGAAFALGRACPRATDDVGDLAHALGQAAEGVVLPEDIRWEPSGGVLSDCLVGRWALFLAADKEGAPRDVWRARVRLTPEGRPLGVAEAHDLTATPLGDDHALVIRGRRAAFATLAYGQEQSVTTLDLEGDPEPAVRPRLAERAMTAITNLQQTGAAGGVARVDVTLEQPARAVGLTLNEASLDIDLVDDAGGAGGNRARRASLDLARGELAAAVAGLHAEGERHLPKRFVFWAVDTVRAIPWVGPAPIAWLEEKVFALRDDAKQLAFKMHASEPSDTLASGAAGGDEVEPPRASVLDTSQTALDSGHWPPANLPSIWKTPEPGEGEWVAPRLPWLRRLATADATTPPAFLRTFVRPDQERPYASVILVAMDMRQLDLDMEAGVEDPKPLTGPHGAGRVPRDPKVYGRVVGAFNGAFKTEHGNYGMMVKKRVLLPPQPGAASVVVLDDSRVGLGTWGNTTRVTGIDGVADESIVSFRQNLDALVDRGEVNPTKRALWGYTLPGSGMQTERTGLCVTDAGHLVYAWGDDVSATMLGRALKMAGCVYALHLDMNPHHTGFIFATIDELKGHKYRSELLSPLMGVSPDRYIEYAPKDFFYVLLHDPVPAALTGPLAASAWQADGGAQPAPTWMPAVWSTRVETPSAKIELLDVEAKRATFRIRAGTKEPDTKTGSLPLYDLAEDDAHRVLFAVGMGASLEKHPGGLATDGKLALAVGGLRRGDAASAVLVAGADGSLAIFKDDEAPPVAPHVDLAELPLLLDGASTFAGGGGASGASAERAALGITPEGRVLVARGALASDAPLVDVLRAAGCTRAVALDRGSHALARIDRAGTSSPPRARYDETTLYAVAVPMTPRAFRFDATDTVAAHARTN